MCAYRCWLSPASSCPPNLVQEIRFRFASSVTQDTVGLFLLEGCFLRCSLVFGAAFALKNLVRFASFRYIWLTEARLDVLALSLDLCAFGIHWILSSFLL